MNVRLIVATITFLVSEIREGQSQSNVPCTTPNNETASCISLFSCPILRKSVGSSNPSTIDFVKKSLCGDSKGDIQVCCGTSETFTTQPSRSNVTEESHRDFVIRKLLPSRKYCGLQHTDDRFYNETETALDEFPWLVQLNWGWFEWLVNESDVDRRCNGVLISNQYVLTDYLCGYYAKRVKLGQHTIDQNVTCIDDPNIPECTEGVIEINVEEKFLWALSSKSGWYNFMLMRLVDKVAYSDYIRPICLPIDEGIRSQNHESLTFSGWGSNGTMGLSKKRLIYKTADSETCYKLNSFLEGNLKSAKVDLICLVPPKGNTVQACNGDHGGPLMFSHEHQWFTHGIFITQSEDAPSDNCSNEHPVYGIAITPKIIEWILSNMRD